MIVTKVFLCLVVVLFAAPKVCGVEQNDTKPSFTGFGFEIIMAKLDYLQYKLFGMESAMKEDRETIEQKLSGAISQMSQMIGQNLTALNTQTNKMLTEETANTHHERMRNEIRMLLSKQDFALFMTASGLNLRSVSLRSCKKNPSKRWGKYLIQPSENDEPFLGYCEQTAFGGGWLVVQHRYDGSVDFYRNWTEYRNGFGSVDGEFWLGLGKLHQITSARKHELLVELKDSDGKYIYARYSKFEIGNEEEQYELKTLGSYTGTAGDSLTYHEGKKFKTKHWSTDEISMIPSNLACQGAWWYSNICFSNLNGLYEADEYFKAILWFPTTSLRYTRMLIREI
ncbi:fibrinogen-like protein A [Anopheles merus]|uniref:fibrinogen-like protein A n=1 Tax=Anopheles merus TaxID=30066 RepID=UPI001BE3DFB8|nr:fibrinogen-like protein A [Anopheles merus]